MSSSVDDISFKDRHGLAKLKGSSNWSYWSNAFMRLMKLKKLARLFGSDWESQYGVITLDTITGASIHHGVSGKTEDDINLAMYLLTLHVNPDLLHIIDAVEYPYDAWESLKKNFASAGISGEFTVVRRMNELRFSENKDEDVNTRLQKFLGQRSEIVAAGMAVGLNFAKLSEAQCLRIEIVNILIRLPDEIFSNFIDGAARRLSTYTSVNECVDELRIWAQTRVELRRSNQQVEAASAHSRSSSPSIKVCSHCKKRGHLEKDCFDLHPEKKTEMEARRAKKALEKKKEPVVEAASAETEQYSEKVANHERTSEKSNIYCALAEVYEFDDYKNTLPPFLEDEEDPIFFKFTLRDVALDANVAEIPYLDGSIPEFNVVSDSQRHIFLMDSAASRHLTNVKDALFNFRPHRVSVSLADKTRVFTEGIGELHVKVTFPGTNATHLIKFSNVLYASWARNLLSVGQLTVQKGFHCSIVCNVMTLSKGSDPVFRAKSFSNNVFQLDYSRLYLTDDDWAPSSEIITAPAISKETKVMTLHMSLGHPSFEVMKTLVNANKISCSLSDLRQSELLLLNCKACAFGKITRRPFPKKPFDHPRSQKPFQLIHTDLKITGIGLRPYLLMIVDDMSQCMWGFFLSKKNESMECIKWLVNNIKTQCGYSLMRLRSDNGGEFVNAEEKKFLAQSGIIHETSVPFSPQQNGVAERSNRTVAEKVTCALVCANLPKEGFWKHAVSWSIHCINRLPTSRKTIPAEEFANEVIDYTDLHPFGCYAVVRSETSKSFDPRATACLFMGYCPHTKGYKVYEIKSERHFIARNVKFFDDEFPGLGGSFNTNKAIDDGVEVDLDLDGPFNSPSVSSDETRDSPDVSASSRFVELNDQVLLEPQATTPLAQSPPPPQSFAMPGMRAVSPISPTPAVIVPDSLDPIPQIPLEIRRSTRETRAPDRFVGGQSIQRNFSALADIEDMDHNEILLNALEEIYGCHVETDEEIEFDPTEPAELEACLARAEGDEDWPENLTMDDMPKNYAEAMASPHAKYFKRAMSEAIAVFAAKGAYDVVELPPGKSALKGRWVFTVKLNKQNKVIAIKARWVVKGYLQKDVDYADVFAPTAKAATVRLFFALVAHYGWHVEQGDIIAAFLTAGLHRGDEVYMEQPHGFVKSSSRHVAFLRRAMWGLRKSPIYFYDSVSGKLVGIGFQRIEGEECMFFRIFNNQMVIMVLYVDDFLLGGPIDLVQKAMKDIENLPDIKVDRRGSLTSGLHMLGVYVKQSSEVISFEQQSYVKRLLEKFDPNGAIKPCNTPCSKSKVDAWASEKLTPTFNKVDPIEFLMAIGPLIWLACNSRPDIAFTVGQLARYSASPTELHWQGFESLLGYLKNTSNYSLIMKRHSNALPISAWGDASHSTDDATRRSTSGMVIKVYGNTVMWSSKRQASVTTSTLEAEYVAFGHTLKSCLWLVKLLDQVQPKIPRPISVLCDNQATVRAVMSESSRSEKLRHVDISLKFIRELCDRKIFEVSWISNTSMSADIFTKALEKNLHLSYCRQINISWT